MAGKTDNIVMLNSKSETEKKDQRKTTKHGDKVKQQITYTQPLTPDQQADFAQNYQAPLAQQYQVDPNTGLYNGDVSQLLGFNPEEYQKEEEAKQKAAAFKRKEAGWANALKVVSEIASAAAGGNVYRNDLANVGREATQQENASKDNVRKMGQAVQNAKRGQELGYAKARQEELKKYYDRYGVKVNQTTTKQGDDVTTTTGGGSVTTGWRQQIDQTKGNKAYGSGYNGARDTVRILKTDQYGNPTGNIILTVPKYVAEGYADAARTSLQQAFDSGKLTEADMKKLSDAGVYDPTADDPLKRWNTNAILAYGKTFKIDAVDQILQDLWAMSDNYDGKPLNLGDYTGEVKQPSVSTTGTSRIAAQQPKETRNSKR